MKKKITWSDWDETFHDELDDYDKNADFFVCLMENTKEGGNEPFHSIAGFETTKPNQQRYELDYIVFSKKCLIKDTVWYKFYFNRLCRYIGRLYRIISSYVERNENEKYKV